jgi:hypothetical protein
MGKLALGAAFCAWLLRAHTPADLAIWGVLKRADPALAEWAVVHRGPVTEGLDLVIAVAGLPRSNVQKASPFLWTEREKLGLFLQEQPRPDRVYSLAITAGPAGCGAHLERVTRSEVVISCMADYARQPHQKFVYDARAKALVSRFSYEPFQMLRVFSSGDGAVFIGTDSQSLLAVEYRPARNPAFRILGEAEAARWTGRIRAEEGTIGIERRRHLYVLPEEHKAVRFGAFSLEREETPRGPELVILERRGAQVRRHELRRSTYEEFAAARPDRVRDGYSREAAQFQERIGPWKLEGDRLWFGKTFYDGEGITGVGGFGYFDGRSGAYRMFDLPEMAGWSVYALDVDAGSVWMALASFGEYGGPSGGVLRFDRQGESIRRLELPDIARDCRILRDRVVFATEFGMAIVEGDRVSRYFVDRTTDGRRRAAQAERPR